MVRPLLCVLVKARYGGFEEILLIKYTREVEGRLVICSGGFGWSEAVRIDT